jgi:hypothetical protein
VVNFGVSRDFTWSPELKPVTLRFDIVNLFDKIYERATAAASACSRPNLARGGVFMPASRRSCEGSR